jgi:subtilisin family serine protease
LLFCIAVSCRFFQDNAAGPDRDFDKPGAHVFWDQGLDGKGQVIGIGDSGIDMHSCFFKDPNVPFSTPIDGSREWRAPEHRKVVYYWGLADPRFQDLVGHGTHTSGSVAGQDPSDPNGRATGAAKSAKLAFVDLSALPSGDVNAPQDMEKNYFPNIYSTGARVFSGEAHDSSKWAQPPPQQQQQWMRVCNIFLAVV